MRAIATRSGPLAAAFLLAGCVTSVEPIVTASNGIWDRRLLGTWEEAGGGDSAVMSQASERTFSVEYTSGGDVLYFAARLGSLRGRSVLDVWPTPRGGPSPNWYTALMARHLMFTVDIESDEIRLSALEPEALEATLSRGALPLAFRRSDDHLVLGGTTEQLRAAIGPYLAKPGALDEPIVWRRQPNANRAGPVAVPCFDTSPWPEADQLFHRDPHWVGGDGASSVDLGDGRILWLFGDSWIDPSGQGTRQGARMVSNSVAIQRGMDPANASIQFYWGRARNGRPTAFIPDSSGERHWFGNGVRVGNRLVLFLNRVRSSNSGLGFESTGWTAWMVENPDREPSEWRMHSLPTPRNPLGVLVGFAAVLRQGDYVYALGAADPIKSAPVYAARWPAERVRLGQPRTPEWWAGDRLGWIPEASDAPRWPLFENGGSEISVHVDPPTGRFLVVKSQGFGPADVMMRAAPALTGPWSDPSQVYRPPEYARPNVMIYAAKAHPELVGGDLVLTYATNTFQFAEQFTDNLIYYPKFVRLSRCR